MNWLDIARRLSSLEHLACLAFKLFSGCILLASRGSERCTAERQCQESSCLSHCNVQHALESDLGKLGKLGKWRLRYFAIASEVQSNQSRSLSMNEGRKEREREEFETKVSMKVSS